MWKTIPNYPSYTISDCGEVKNKYGKTMAQSSNQGYWSVGLAVEKIQKNERIHRLVAEAFIPNPNNFPIVNHIDGNKYNNTVNNLQWTTYQGNMLHAHATNLVNSYVRGVRQLDMDGNVIEIYSSLKDAGIAMGVTFQAIYKSCIGSTKTCKGFRWEYVNSQRSEIPSSLDQFKPVIGFPEYMISMAGDIYSKRAGRLMKPCQDANGYICIQFQVNRNRKNCFLHRLIAEHFIPNPLGKPIVNHIDGIKTNNSVDNLEWVTYRENNLHYHLYTKTAQKCAVGDGENSSVRL